MTGSDPTSGRDLTPREREVLAMVAAGLTNREIGEALFISESTAGVHVSHLMAKLGVSSRTEAAAWAYQAGVVQAAPGSMVYEGPPGDAAGSQPEPRAGWFGRLRDRLRQPDGRVALAIAGVVVLAAITVGLAIAVLNGKQPGVGDLSSASASPNLDASAPASAETSPSGTAEPSLSPSIEASPTPGNATPTPIPLPSGTWSVTGSMSVNRSNATTTLLRDGTVLVAGGGQVGPERARSSAELYHPTTGEWTTTGDMSEGRAGHTATLLDDGTVLVAGGEFIGPESTYRATAEIFDPKTGTWHPTSPMNAVHYGHTATLLADGTVLIAGGISFDIGADPTAGGHYTTVAEIYDPRDSTWTSVASMADGRSEHTATRLKDGTVLVAGGYRTNGTSIGVAVLFHPDSRTWTDAGRMITARHAHTATLLQDGTVLVTGGSGDLGLQASTEVYHPSTKSWTAVGSMAEPRGRGATATLLRDGTVLVTGGMAIECWRPPKSSTRATASGPLRLRCRRVGLGIALRGWTMGLCWLRGVKQTAPAFPR